MQNVSSSVFAMNWLCVIKFKIHEVEHRLVEFECSLEAHIVQVGERSIVGGRPGTCDADCPIPYVACPSGGSEADATTCTGAGRCLSNIGFCDCFEGYAVH